MQLDLPNIARTAPRWGGVRRGAGRKPANPLARANVPHSVRPGHKSRLPVHVTMRAGRGVPSLRTELVRNLLKQVLKKQAKRAYADKFHVVQFSIQNDHLHLIVEAIGPVQEGRATPRQREGSRRQKASEAARDTLRRGVSGFAISFARRLNRRLGRTGRVWSDRHHRRDLTTPTEVRNTILYVLQNYIRHGTRTFGAGIVDTYSSAPHFGGWRDPHVTIIETEPWPIARPRTWLLETGWTRARGGLLKTSERPPAAKSARQASIVKAYVPDCSIDG